MCGTLMTRLLLSRGMSSQLQLSSSCSVPEIGVNSILSPKSITCSKTLCFQALLDPREVRSLTHNCEWTCKRLTWNNEAKSWYPSSLLRITRRKRLICRTVPSCHYLSFKIQNS